MKEQEIKILRKEIEFENSNEKIGISISIENVKDTKKIIDFLDTMFKEVKEKITY